MHNRKKSQWGFTLIELMVVVAIMAVLAAIAYPAYQDQVRKSRRVDAQGALMELAQFMQRYYTENHSYTGAVLPFVQSPKDGTSKYYNLSLSAVTANTYTLQAVPIQADPTCGSMTLTNTGAKLPAACW